MKCNEIMRNTDENNINFANHNKLATNYVGKMLAILYKQLGFCMVRLIGLEPTRRKTPDPKSGASTNFATGAIHLQR